MKFKLPIDHQPYMVLPRNNDGFSCANCRFLFTDTNGEHHCGNTNFASFMKGDTFLRDARGEKLEDPSRACSDWFEPA